MGLIVADRCCVLSSQADGQGEEEVGVAVREEVTFVNMSEDSAHSEDEVIFLKDVQVWKDRVSVEYRFLVLYTWMKDQPWGTVNSFNLLPYNMF